MESPVVQYGVDPSTMSVVKGNISKTYTAADMCSEPANDTNAFVDPGYIHRQTSNQELVITTLMVQRR